MYMHLFDMSSTRKRYPPPAARTPATAVLLPLPCACANIRRLSRLVTRLYDAELHESGLEVTQFGVLSAVRKLGDASHGQLARGFGMDSTTVTRTVGLLERRGWVARRIGADRRERIYRITAAGRRQLAEARAGWQRAEDRVREIVGDEALTAVLAAATAMGTTRAGA
jgi:DNA-binding MarR family transcriptional regulator